MMINGRNRNWALSARTAKRTRANAGKPARSDRAGLAEVRHGARGFALDSPLEQGGFELALALGCIAGDGNAGAGAGGRIGFVGQNSRRERDSLISAEISLIADLNSLQDHKKFPVPVRRELARKPLVQGAFLERLMRRRAQNR